MLLKRHKNQRINQFYRLFEDAWNLCEINDKSAVVTTTYLDAAMSEYTNRELSLGLLFNNRDVSYAPRFQLNADERASAASFIVEVGAVGYPWNPYPFNPTFTGVDEEPDE